MINARVSLRYRILNCIFGFRRLKLIGTHGGDCCSTGSLCRSGAKAYRIASIPDIGFHFAIMARFRRCLVLAEKPYATRNGMEWRSTGAHRLFKSVRKSQKELKSTPLKTMAASTCLPRELAVDPTGTGSKLRR
jgi:hypothetical protein